MRLFFSVLDYVEVTFFCFFSLINSSNGITATDRNASTENASKNDASFACWSILCIMIRLLFWQQVLMGNVLKF